MKHRAEAPAIVLSPHLDDAVLSAWSVLRGPGEVLVVNVCTAVPPAGTVGWYDRMRGIDDSAPFMEQRLGEDAEAVALAGREWANLGFLDDQYRSEPLDPREVRGSLEAVVSEASVLYAPAGLGGHPDHYATRELALEIGRADGIPVRLYADLPYAVRVGWPAWVTGLPERPYLLPEGRWEEFLATASCPRGSLVPEVHSLTDAEAEAKVRALETYRTEFENLNAGPLDRLRHPEIRGYELHWDVT
jgi:LmbE family N-acetylglucosaminyl deacetylase